MIPKKCGKCKSLGDYTRGPYVRSPHYCCELIWRLFQQDYRVNPEELDEHCPYLNSEFALAVAEIKKSLNRS